MPLSAVFEVVEDYGLTVSYEFKNEVIDSLLGTNYINALWLQPLAKYTFKVAWFDQTIFNYLKDLFYFVKGSTETFRFLDSVDNLATTQPFDTELGVTTQGIIFENDGVLMLGKKYTLGTNYVIRPITRPKVDSIIVYDGITPVTANIDWDTGVVLSGGDVNYTWEGFFYVPVRFENDIFPTEIITYDNTSGHEMQYYSVPDLRVIEVRESSLIPNVNLSNSINSYYPLFLEYKSTLENTAKTDIFTADSGYESRDELDSYKYLIKSQPTLINYEQKEYLLTLYRLMLGNLGRFRFNEQESLIDNFYRFNEPLSFETVLDDDSGNNRLYKVNNLSLIEDFDDVKTHYCYLWKIVRPDAQVFGFTNHNYPITYNSETYYPNINPNGTSPTKTAMLNTDSTELSAVFKVDGVTELDLITGKFNNSTVSISIYDWLANSLVIRVFNGFIGGHSIGYLENYGKQYQMEVLSIAQSLDSNISVQTSSECRHDFLSQGYGKCNRTIDANVQVTNTVTGITAPNIIQIGTGLDNWQGYKYGILEFLDGDLAGIKIYIADASGLNVTLLYAPPVSPALGVSVRLTRHCNKTIEACDSYDNVVNYGGQPRLPGNDLVIAGVDE